MDRHNYLYFTPPLSQLPSWPRCVVCIESIVLLSLPFIKAEEEEHFHVLIKYWEVIKHFVTGDEQLQLVRLRRKSIKT